MNKSVSWLTLDLNRRDVQGSVSFGQGETGRRLCIRLVENGKPYEIGRGCFAVMSGTLPDGSPFFNECVISDNVIVYDVTPKNASQVGVIECEVQLYSYDGGLLRSPRLHMVIHKGIFNVDDVEDSQEFTALTAWLVEFGEMVGTEELATESRTLRGAINEVSFSVGILGGMVGADHVISAADFKRFLLDYNHPIGEVFTTKDASFDPNVAWGGTWVLTCVDRFPIGAGSKYSTGALGGSETHTLTLEEMPKHNHNVIDNNGSRLLGYQGSLAAGTTWGLAYKTDGISSPWLTSDAGGSKAFSIMPPYEAMFFWERIA